MKSIIVRCDASNNIGSGHIIRSRTLARELKRQGDNVTFICRDHPGNMIKDLEKEFQVLKLEEKNKNTGLEKCGSETNWLRCSQLEDANDCIKAITKLKRENIDLIIVDHYGIDMVWEKQLMKSQHHNGKRKLLAIDDLANRKHSANILLDQNFYGGREKIRYDKLVPKDCKQLLGPKYALLGSEYEKLHKSVSKRKKVETILVYFGGVDKFNLIEKTLQALEAKETSDMRIDVIVGFQTSEIERLKKYAENKQKIKIHKPQPSIAEFIADADLCIGAGGSTTWERICLKLPTIVVTVAANQQEFSEAIHDKGYIKLLGKAETVTSKRLRAAIKTTINNLDKYDFGKNLVDGLGAKRVSRIIKRELESEDQI